MLLVIISVTVVLFAILLFIDFVQLCIFLVRGIKDRRRHRGALSGEGESVVAGPTHPYLAPGEKPPSPRPTGLGLADNGIAGSHNRGESLERGATSHSSTTLDDNLGRPVDVAGKSVTP